MTHYYRFTINGRNPLLQKNKKWFIASNARQHDIFSIKDHRERERGSKFTSINNIQQSQYSAQSVIKRHWYWTLCRRLHYPHCATRLIDHRVHVVALKSPSRYPRSPVEDSPETHNLHSPSKRERSLLGGEQRWRDF